MGGHGAGKGRKGNPALQVGPLAAESQERASGVQTQGDESREAPPKGRRSVRLLSKPVASHDQDNPPCKDVVAADPDNEETENPVPDQLPADAKQLSAEPAADESADPDDDMDAVHSRISTQKTSVMQSKKRIVDRGWFVGIVYGTILVNAIQMGVELDLKPERGTSQAAIFDALEYVAWAVFLAEAVVKLLVLRAAYFISCSSDAAGTMYSPEYSNWIDLVVVVMSTVEVFSRVIGLDILGGKGAAVQCLRLLRLVRISRLFRMIKSLSELTLLLDAVADVAKTIFHLMGLLVIILYTISILCVSTIGDDEDTGAFRRADSFDTEEINPHALFGTMVRAMYTLFTLFTLSDLERVGRALYEQAPVYLFIVLPFVVFTAFGVTSVVVAIVIKNILTRYADLDQQLAKMELTRRLKTLEGLVDSILSFSDRPGVVTVQSVSAALQSAHVQDLLREVNIPSNFGALDIMLLLDNNGSGEIPRSECLLALYSLLDEDQFQQKCLKHVSLNQSKTLSKRIEVVVEALVSKMGLDPKKVLDDVLARERKMVLGGGHALEVGVEEEQEPSVVAESENMDVLAEAAEEQLQLLGALRQRMEQLQSSVDVTITHAEEKALESIDEAKRRLVATVEDRNAARFSNVSSHVAAKLVHLEEQFMKRSTSSKAHVFAMVCSAVEDYLLAAERSDKLAVLMSRSSAGASALGKFRAHVYVLAKTLEFSAEYKQLHEKVEAQDKEDPEYENLLHPEHDITHAHTGLARRIKDCTLFG
mmetsp:Transcript_21860/g.53205  ORF Transcript_21860/g.53205 Transcript_21860/m.53205 type:complete len:763 (+) Transcript_21860:86-2374(+)